MSLLHADDLEPGAYVWIEQAVRFLVPKPEASLAASVCDSVHRDVLRSAMVGAAGRCAACGGVTIETDGYPWGQVQYAMPGSAPGVYCPHCDGAEDMG